MSEENKKQEQPASKQIDATIDEVTANHGFEAEKKAPVIIKVIGVGGGAINAVNHMYSQHIKGVSFAVIDSDGYDLYESPVPNRLLIGANMIDGIVPVNVEAPVSAPEPAESVKKNVKKTKPGWFSKFQRTISRIMNGGDYE